ncbi:MAG: hypothetical protein ACQEV0_15005 [Bacillota bacterium]
MKIELGLTGGKMTMVPDEQDLNQKRNYYVYEWFIKETGQVIYLGKGTSSRYKNTKRNDYFNRLFEKFECDVRFVKDGLTEYEALVLEEELFVQLEKDGHVLTNIVVPNGVGPYADLEPYEYMKTPLIRHSRIDEAYYGIKDIKFDPVDGDKLMKVHIPNKPFHAVGRLYVETEDVEVEQVVCEGAVKPLLDEVVAFIESNGGKVMKSPAKSVQSLICYSEVTYDAYSAYKEKGYEVYHLIDVISYLRQK